MGQKDLTGTGSGWDRKMTSLMETGSVHKTGKKGAEADGECEREDRSNCSESTGTEGKKEKKYLLTLDVIWKTEIV